MNTRRSEPEQQEQSSEKAGGRTIRVFAPATVSNLSCGFDIIGFALDGPGDEVELTLRDEPGVRISLVTGDDGRLPTSAAENTAGVAAASMLAALRESTPDLVSSVGVDLSVHKMMPLGSGLGSSAASAAATVFGLNELLGRPYTREQLVPFVVDAERVACGSGHADNAAPAVMGGVVLIRSCQPLDVISLPVTLDLWCTIVHPRMEIPTEHARRILPREIPLTTAVTQWGNVAGLITGLLTGDLELISRSAVDAVAEPARGKLIPGFDDVREMILSAGAVACGISGAGPSIFGLCRNKADAVGVALAGRMAFALHDLETDIYISSINMKGPRIV